MKTYVCEGEDPPGPDGEEEGDEESGQKRCHSGGGVSWRS